MSFSAASYLANCSRLCTGIDPLLNLFLKLHVASDFTTEHAFKHSSVQLLRASNLYKKFKLPQAQVENGLLLRPLTPIAFYALALLYGVKVHLKVDRFYLSTAVDTTTWVDCGKLTITKKVADNALLPVCAHKPLYAVSHYTSKDLSDMCASLRLPKKGTKADMYADLKEYLSRLG